MRQLGVIILQFSLLVLIYACGTDLFDRRISEGEIDYDVSYPYMDADNMLADFMPDKMTLRFKDNQFVSELSAGMGMFKTNFISNSNDFSLVHSVKLINKKYVSSLNKENADLLNQEYPKPIIIRLNEKKEIAGYTCSKALVVFNDIGQHDFYIYYTDEINLDHPNWSTPFDEIDGVMMAYEIEKYDIIMRFVATRVTKTEIDDSSFIIPEEYETISYQQLEKEMNEIFETFNY